MTAIATPVKPETERKIGRLEQACIDYRANYLYFVYRPWCGCAACRRAD